MLVSFRTFFHILTSYLDTFVHLILKYALECISSIWILYSNNFFGNTLYSRERCYISFAHLIQLTELIDLTPVLISVAILGFFLLGNGVRMGK